jgi:hypothetical protein
MSHLYYWKIQLYCSSIFLIEIITKKKILGFKHLKLLHEVCITQNISMY